MTGWTADDFRVVALWEAEFPNVRVVDVIHHSKENSMTETAPEITWDDDEQDSPAPGGATYPEYPYSLADHIYTWSPKLPDGSMLVVRAQTAEALAEAAEALAPVASRLMAAWGNVTGRQTPATPPPFGPNVSAPMAPGYQGPPQQAAPQWGAPQQQAPQGGGWNGGGQQQSQRKEYPAPQGWYRMNVPFPGGKDQLHALAQSQGIPKGNPNKGGAYNFFGLTPTGQPGKAWYCSPQAAPAFAQFQPVPA